MDANLISSQKYSDRDKHSLMLDLDTTHYYLPSSSHGHGHLVFNTHLSFDAIVEILTVLNKHGIVQDGVLEATKDRGYISLRPPGVDKHNPEDDAWLYDQDIIPRKEVTFPSKSQYKLDVFKDPFEELGVKLTTDDVPW
jgi:hypothetical protein